MPSPVITAAEVASPLELPPACWAATIAPSILRAAQDVLLGDVGDLVRQHARHLVLAFGGQDQARVHPDVAAERRKGVDLAIAQQEKSERLLGSVAGSA